MADSQAIIRDIILTSTAKRVSDRVKSLEIENRFNKQLEALNELRGMPIDHLHYMPIENSRIEMIDDDLSSNEQLVANLIYAVLNMKYLTVDQIQNALMESKQLYYKNELYKRFDSKTMEVGVVGHY